MQDVILHPKNRFTWVLLAFQGGYINIGGFLTIHQFVAYITGFSAHLGIALSQHHFLQSFYFATVPAFFLFGAFSSSLVNEKRKRMGKSPIYIHALLSMSIIFVLVAILGNLDVWRPYGVAFNGFEDFILMSLLSFSCGMQNAMFTNYSHSIIRTTHLTGLTTDLGIGLAKYMVNKEKKEGLMIKIRMDLIFAFLVGSIAGAIIFPVIEFNSFYVPALLSAFIGARLYYHRRILLLSQSHADTNY